MELKVTGKTHTTGTRKNKAGETEDVDLTNYKLENSSGSVKVRIKCADYDYVGANEDDEFELKQSKAQTKLSETKKAKK